MRVLVCGGRNFTDDDLFYEVMNKINDTYNFHNKIDCIISGGARGADTLASQFAKVNNIDYDEYLPDWEQYGAAAGPIRNREMLEFGKPDLIVAFPGGSGTANMAFLGRKAGVRVLEVSPGGEVYGGIVFATQLENHK